MANRRQFVTGVVTASTVAIAGCSNSDPDPEEEESNPDPEEEESDPDPEEGESDPDPEEGESGEQTGPKAAMEQYMTATQSGDAEAVNEVLHPESINYPVEDASSRDIIINEITEISVNELVERQFSDEATEEEIQEAIESSEDELETIETELGADDTAIILASWEEPDGTTRQQDYVVVQQDGDWLVYNI